MEAMYDSSLILLSAAASLYSALDAALALWSGRAPGLFHRWLGNRSVKGSITRKGRPELFRRYVVSAILAAIIFAVRTTWLCLRPETVGR